MTITPLEKQIGDAIAPVIEETGHHLVCVEMGQEGDMPVLRVMCENPDTKRINIDECATISREVSTILDVEDFIKYQYRLEVSSPGIDRPLTRPSDFAAYIGHDARVWLSMPMETGQKKLRGQIQSVEGDSITLVSDTTEFEIDFDRMAKAKLVLTDKLIKETAKTFEVSNKSE